MKITNTTSNDINTDQGVCMCPCVYVHVCVLCMCKRVSVHVCGWMDKGACRPPYT